MDQRKGLDEESKKLLLDTWIAFARFSFQLSPFVIALGFLYAVVNGNKGLPLFIVGIVYLVLPIFASGKRRSDVLYPGLLAGGATVLVLSLAFYLAVGPNLSDLNSSGYYSLVALSAALFLAGITDLSIQRGHKEIITSVKNELEKFREEDAERWGEEEN